MKFLRFPDERTFLIVTEPYTDEEGNINIPNLDKVGLISEGGDWDEEGNQITPPTMLAGYHANMSGPVPVELEPYVIERPKNPYRVFAGAIKNDH